MAKQSRTIPSHRQKQLLAALKQLRVKLCEINQKLDHLIRHYRRYHITDDFSPEREFRD